MNTPRTPKTIRKSLAKNRRGVEMAEVAVTLTGIAIAGALAVKALGYKIGGTNANMGGTLSQ